MQCPRDKYSALAVSSNRVASAAASTRQQSDTTGSTAQRSAAHQPDAKHHKTACCTAKHTIACHTHLALRQHSTVQHKKQTQKPKIKACHTHLVCQPLPKQCPPEAVAGDWPVWAQQGGQLLLVALPQGTPAGRCCCCLLASLQGVAGGLQEGAANKEST